MLIEFIPLCELKLDCKVSGVAENFNYYSIPKITQVSIVYREGEVTNQILFVAYIASECHSYGNQVLKLKRKFYNKKIKHLTCISHSCTDIDKQTITQHFIVIGFFNFNYIVCKLITNQFRNAPCNVCI